MSRTADPHAALVRALCAILSLDASSLSCSAAEPWCSVTFSGARHRFEFAIPQAEGLERARRFAGEAAERDFDLTGHLVADMIADMDGEVLKVEALTVVMD